MKVYKVGDEFLTYSELVHAALHNPKKYEAAWLGMLKRLQARQEAERSLIRDARTKTPGRADSEVLSHHKEYLDKNFPLD